MPPLLTLWVSVPLRSRTGRGNVQQTSVAPSCMASNSAGDLIDFSYRPTEGLSDTLERKLGMFSVVIISLSAMLGTGLFVLPALVMVDMGGGTVPVSGIWLAYMLAASGHPSCAGLQRRAVNCDAIIRRFLRVHRENFRAISRDDRRRWPLGGLNVEDSRRTCWIQGISMGPRGASWCDYRYRDSRPHPVGPHHNHQHTRREPDQEDPDPIVALMVAFIAILCIWSIFTLPMNWDVAFGEGAYGAGWEDVAHATAFVFVAYAGVTKIAAVGGEIKDPSKNIPYGMILSLLIACALYVMVTIVMVSAVDPRDTLTPKQARRGKIPYTYSQKW